ncbi:hypothetical protein LCGC14_1787870 [marine sediment metagenome]|uniref:Uncharacterized protein n=1 Tax=marine sediment metagenome TaxID=412755 RepID=A0A0F9JT30_9ZZZZ
MKIQMELFKSSGVWLVKTDDPKVMELFGTDTLPAPFSDSTPWETDPTTRSTGPTTCAASRRRSQLQMPSSTENLRSWRNTWSPR